MAKKNQDTPKMPKDPGTSGFGNKYKKAGARENYGASGTESFGTKGKNYSAKGTKKNPVRAADTKGIKKIGKY